MEGERLGRVVAVALLALLTPVACAAFGVGTPSVSGLPLSSGSAPPAVQSDDGREAPTAVSEVTEITEEEFPMIIRQAGYWAVPASHSHNDARVRGFACPLPLSTMWSATS
jgi:hypothetical protein